jgi:hypothetical protein
MGDAARKSTTCNLCGETAILVKSHIIPKSCFRSIRGQGAKTFAGDPGIREEYVRNGIWDRIVCGACENKFNDPDAYAKFVLLDEGKVPSHFPRVAVRPRNEDGVREQFLEFKGIDYGRFKLFFLSLLWRMSVSDHAFFSKVQLPKERMDLVSRMVQESDPGDPDEFCVTIAKFREHEPARIGMQPRIDEFYGLRVCRVGFEGYTALIKTNDAITPAVMVPYVLKPGRRLKVPLREFSGSIEKNWVLDLARRRGKFRD